MIGAGPVALAAHNLPRAAGAGSKQTGDAAAAHKFEAMAIAQLLKPMFATLGKAEPPFGSGGASKEFRPFLIEAIAKSMEARGGLGLAPMIEQALSAKPPDGKTAITGAIHQ